MDNRDPLTPRISGVKDRGFDAILQDQAAIGLMDTAKDLDERTLASPILASKRMHPASVKAEIYVAQNLDGSKTFHDRAQFNYRTVTVRNGLMSLRFGAQLVPLYCWPHRSHVSLDAELQRVGWSPASFRDG
jgi:hypothetical protein